MERVSIGQKQQRRCQDGATQPYLPGEEGNLLVAENVPQAVAG